jgi:hypothetical protein
MPEFYDMDLQIAGSTTWFNFCVREQADEDPDDNCRRISADDQEVRQLAGNCP